MENYKKRLKVDQIEHLGLILGPSKYGYRLSLDWYGKIKNKSTLGPLPIGKISEDGKYYTEEYYIENYPKVIKNYEINMQHFKSLDKSDFLSTLSKLKDEKLKIKDKIYQFKECTDLSEYSINGDYLYIMVLGDYKQLYIGKTSNPAKRIKQHWVGNKEFDRLIFGNINRSKISIDSFRAYDTTEVLIMDCTDGFNSWCAEEILVEKLPQKYITNRMAGGEFGGGLKDAIINRKEIEPIEE